MKGSPLVRCSYEHIAEVARIDIPYNDEVNQAKKAFKKARPGVEVEGNPDWLAILAEIEERRLEEHASMKERIIDLPKEYA